MSDPLTFDDLRRANALRVGQFKNRKGEPAHSTEDGHDWSPAQWLQATVGELGEYAMERHRFERDFHSAPDKASSAYAQSGPRELADFVTYSDILARRSFDVVKEQADDQFDAAQTFQWIIACLGEYANARKKYDRGDIDISALRVIAAQSLVDAKNAIDGLLDGDFIAPHCPVVQVSGNGVNLGEAVRSKFNEVSERIGVNVRL